MRHKSCSTFPGNVAPNAEAVRRGVPSDDGRRTGCSTLSFRNRCRTDRNEAISLRYFAFGISAVLFYTVIIIPCALNASTKRRGIQCSPVTRVSVIPARVCNENCVTSPPPSPALLPWSHNSLTNFTESSMANYNGPADASTTRNIVISACTSLPITKKVWFCLRRKPMENDTLVPRQGRQFGFLYVFLSVRGVPSRRRKNKKKKNKNVFRLEGIFQILYSEYFFKYFFMNSIRYGILNTSNVPSYFKHYPR